MKIRLKEEDINKCIKGINNYNEDIAAYLELFIIHLYKNKKY